MVRTTVIVLAVALLSAGLTTAQLDQKPGTMLNSFTTPVQVVGMAAVGDSLWSVTSSSTASVLYEFDVTTGKVLSTIANQFVGPYGMDYDTRRKQFVMTAAGPGTIGRVDMTGKVTTVFKSPTTRPIGVAYDWNRDAYWVADWSANVLHLLDATAGTTVQPSFSLTASGCTRSADVAYSMFNDLLVIVGRNSNKPFIFRAGNPPVFLGAPSFGTTIPGGARGALVYPRTQTFWTDSYSSPYQIFEFDLGLPRVVAKKSVNVGNSLAIGWVAGGSPNLAYQGAASFTEFAPGITFGTRWFPLAVDNLFFMSVTTPQVFKNFNGLLDSNGTASGGVNVPNIAALVGNSFSIAWITADKSSPYFVKDISGPWKVNITK